MYDLNLSVPNLTSKKYSDDNRFLLLKNYLYELNETLSHALDVKNQTELKELSEKLASANKIQQESLAILGAVNRNSSDKGGVINLTCEGTDLSENLTYYVKCYESSGLVWVSLRFEAARELSADVTHTIAKIPQKTPRIFTPLQSLANFSGGGQSTGGIVYGTGDIVLRSDTAIAPGTLVYISGFYII